MTGTDIRDALHEIGDTLPAPAPDRVSFQREVRRERRRRTSGRALAAGAVVACVGVAATYAGSGVLLPQPAPAPGPATSAPALGEVGDLVYAIVDGELMALDGVDALRVGVRAEGLIGFTQERVYAVGADSRIEVRSVVDDPEGPAPAGFRAEPSPVAEAVQSAALSADGRFLAWLDLDGTVTVRDLVADALAFTVDVPKDGYVADISAAGVLVASGTALTLHQPDGDDVAVPNDLGGTWGSQTAGSLILASDGTTETSVLDLDGDRVRELRTFSGVGALSPTGESLVVVDTSDGGGGLRLWEPTAGERAFTGLDGARLTQARWVDDGSDTGLVLVAGHDGSTPRLWACSPLELTCGVLAGTDGDVRINE